MHESIGEDALVSGLTAPQWRQIVDSATDTAIISTDPSGLVTSWNAGATRILGWSESDMLGQELGRIFTPDDRMAGLFHREIQDATRYGRGGGEEGWRQRRDGTLIWASGEITPIRD